MSRKFVRRGVKLGAIVGAVFFLGQVFLRKQAPKRSDNPTRTPAPPKLTNATPPSNPAPGPLNGTDIGATVPDADADADAEADAEAEAEAAVEAIPAPVAPSNVEAPSPDADADEPWVEPVDGTCPSTHPIKAKLSSRIFHAPGGLAYDRTTPDRCYRDAAAAEADGFRPAKR